MVLLPIRFNSETRPWIHFNSTKVEGGGEEREGRGGEHKKQGVMVERDQRECPPFMVGVKSRANLIVSGFVCVSDDEKVAQPPPPYGGVEI